MICVNDMKLWGAVFLLCLLTVQQNAYAVEVENLYEADVVAESVTSEDRLQAIEKALQRVLLRILTGQNIMQDETVKAVMANAENYVAEYQFSLAKGEKQQARLLRVLFNEEFLISTFRPSGLALWNEIRPRTLVWLVVEENNLLQFFDPDLMPDIDRALKKASKQKKIPLLLPMQDLKEKRLLTIGDVLSAYSEHLLEVSARYDVMSTLAGKLVRQGKCWKAEWTLYFDGKIMQWQTACGTLDGVMMTATQGIYQRLARVYAAKPKFSAVNSLIMKVSGIENMKQLVALRDELEGFSIINTATWLSSHGGYNFFRVFYQGARDEMNEMLEIGRVLQVQDTLKPDVEEVHYRWLKN